MVYNLRSYNYKSYLLLKCIICDVAQNKNLIYAKLKNIYLYKLLVNCIHI